MRRFWDQYQAQALLSHTDMDGDTALYNIVSDRPDRESDRIRDPPPPGKWIREDETERG